MGLAPTDELLSERFAWFRDATQRGLTEAGKDYLRHLLSAEQLALYRVVTRDADRFPDLGRQHQRNVAQGRTRILRAYLERTTRKNGWGRRDSAQDAALYEALLRAGIYEEALHGLLNVRPHGIAKHARLSSEVMWQLLGSRRG